MNLRQLHCFIALAETLHFGKAAQRMNMTQPPFSRQIAALEVDVGTVLFHRHSRTVALTPAGENFYDNIQRLMDDLDFAVKSAKSVAMGNRGELKVAFTMYAAWSVVPKLVSNFSLAYPDVSLILNETLPRDLQDTLSKGEADIGISFPVGYPHDLHSRPLYRERLCAVVPNSHRLAEKEIISVADLAEDKFVTFPQKTAPALHEAVIRCCRQGYFEPDVRVETNLQQTIVNLVAEGIGVALVPESMRRMQLQGARFLEFIESSYIELSIYWHKHSANPCVPVFIKKFETLKLDSSQA